MRGKKYKKLLTWILCICMLVGMIPNTAFAVSAEQQDQTVAATEAQENKDDQKTSGTSEETQKKEETTKSSESKTEETTKAEEKTTEEEKIKETTEEKTEKSQIKEKDAKADKKAKIRDASGAKVEAVKLVDKNGSVWGAGLITGSGKMDDKSWNKTTDEDRGYDSSVENDIIRSFDTIKYNVTTTFANLGGEEHTLVYEVTLPDDDQITLDEDSMTTAKSVDCKKNSDNTKTYTCKYVLEKNFSSGEKQVEFNIKVGNKHQGDTVRPEIKAYLNDNAASALKVENMETVTVTTAPMYNIVLKKYANETISRDVYDFSQKGDEEQTYYSDNAKDYDNKKVEGYKCTYGFALEVRKPGEGIKGVELPDSSKDFTFDIDISDATLNGKKLSENGFGPLLYYSGPNYPGSEAITELPFTKEYTNEVLVNKGCYNSGNLTMSQEGTTLHVTVKDFKIDQTKFPKGNYAGTSYWEELDKIREGIFSTFRFQLVYPYINEKSENLQTKLGDGSINASAEVKNMVAVSEQNNQTKTETSLADNKQSNTWSLQSGSKRNQQIFYSSRKNIIDSYTPGKIWNDGDIAPVGANDLAFTVTYNDKNVGASCPNRNMPVAIDQFVLFDRSAIENVEFSKSTQGNQNGYECSVLYAVRKSGRMDNDSMKTATLDEFDFYTEKPEGGCDGVLVQYRGTNLGAAELTLRAQFTATVSKDAEVADKVYMITAFTNTWNASDFEDQILKSTGKNALSELTKAELSESGKKLKPNEVEGTALVNKVDTSLPTIDNRGNYTVPRYENGAYMADKDHKSDISFADGLYIVPYTTTVTKTVAQKDDDGNQRRLYNLARKQQYVDYKIDSSIKYWADIEIPEGSTTTVYLEDTLPEGLTYVSGSAYWGGNYTSKFPLAGKVDGGQQVEPTVTTKADGTTVLKWEIQNVTLKKGELPSLYYSCKISNSVETNKSLENTVSIQTNEDKRPAFKELDNLSDAAVSVTRDKEFYIDKRGGDSLELEDSSYYDLLASNTTDEPKTDLVMIDTLPYEKDNKSTQFKGQYAITKLTMNANEVNHATDMELWYTDNQKYIGKTAKDIEESEITEANGWKKATATGHETDTITFTGDGLIGSWPTAIAYKDASLDNNTMADLRLEYKALAGAENDSFENVWSTMSNNKEIKAKADTDVYDRTIEGTVWVDKNKDGKIDDDETKLEGVKVTLLVKNEKGEYVPYESYHETINGTTEKSPYTVETDENGHYKFRGLPSGEYQVKFESSDGTDLGKYDVTEPNADKDVTKTSKVEKENAEKDNGELKSGTIKDITMPTLEQMVADREENGTSYNLPDQNLGLIVPTTEISVTKEWKDNNDQDGKRPAEVEVTLYANDKATDKTLTIKPDAQGNWTGSFKNLPKYDESNPKKLTTIKYSVKETTVPEGYESTVTGNEKDGYTIINSHTPELTEVSGSKTWNDKDDQDRVRPDEITIRLYNGDQEVDHKTVTKADGWSWKFNNLPKYENGNLISYHITEDNVADYQSSVNGYNITNTHTPGKTSVAVTKKWEDANDQDGIRPTSITVQLYADGVPVAGKTMILTKATNWSGSFTELDEKKDGKAINYTIQEISVNGYVTTIEKDSENGYLVTNIHTPATTAISGSKTWDDKDDQDGKRPESIKIHLLANGEEVASKEVTATDNWSWNFTDLPKNANGEEIKYTVTEDKVEGYTTKVEGYNVTNSHTPETTAISGSKTWKDNDDQDGKRPESITIRLLANGKEAANKTVTADNNWSWNFTNLSKYEGGKEIVYTVTEDAVADYTTTVDGYNITNAHTPGKVSVGVTKSWLDNNDQDGVRPEKITIHLYADGEDTGKTLELTAANNWSGTFTELAEKKAGKTIEYTVKEDKVDGYTSKVTGDVTKGYVVENTHTPATTEVSGSKTWDDKDNQDGKRPDTIIIRLLANGKEVANKQVTAKDNWSYSFKDLAKYEAGKEIVYTITEDAVADYVTTVNGYNVTNSYTPGQISVTVTKSWNDKNDKDKKRPDKVTIHLYADGVDTGKTLELTKATNWSGSFTNLDMYKSGTKIEYTIKEDKVAGYTSAITGDADTGYVVTNTHNPKKPELPDDKNAKDKDSKNSSSNTNSSSNSNTTSNTVNTNKAAKTGDTNAIIPWMLTCVVSVGAIFVMIGYRRRRSNK